MADDVTKKSLKYSVYDGAAYSTMDGLTASFITPYAVALKMSVSMIAALTYVPQLLGAFVQLFAAKLAEIVKDRRKILVIGSLIHAIFWIPLLLIPYANPNQKFLLIVYVAVQSAILQLINPIGSSLLGDIVPKYERGRFFGLRNRIVGVCSFIAALSAGFVLDYFSLKNPFIGFAILFSMAFMARLVSAFFKSLIHNPVTDIAREEKFSLLDFIKRMDRTNYGRFVIYVAVLKFAVYIASPFFAVYMLKDLKLGYMEFTILIAAELIASFIAMGIWGKLIDDKGTKFVLYITGMLIPIIPFLWLFSKNFYYLMLVEAFSGLSWAGFNLSSSNFIFDAVRPENRIRCIAYFKFFESISIFLGALLGGYIVDKLPAWIFLSGIPFLFLVSGVLRFAASLSMLPMLKETRLIELDIGHTLFKRYITIRPSEGFVYEVIGKYNKLKDKVQQVKDRIAEKKKKIFDKKELQAHNKRLLKFMDSNLPRYKEKHDITDMHEIEHITEEIEKGKINR